MKGKWLWKAMAACLLATGNTGALAGELDWFFATAEPHEQGWYYHDWFGWMHEEAQGWIYHLEHGLQYVCGDSVESFYLYDQQMDTWLWSSCEYYPYLYKFGPNHGWFWYYCGCTPGNRWFKCLRSEEDFSEQVLNIPVSYILVAPGTFTMGSPSSERGRFAYPNEIEHQVTLARPFVISPTEITCTQYQAVLQQAADYGYTDVETAYWDNEADPYGLAPAVGISWHGVIKWLNLKSEVEGKVPAYYSQPGFSSSSVIRSGTPIVYCNFEAVGYRLPTSAEWEYACRAGTTTAFYTGDITYTASSPLDPNLGRAGWYFPNSDSALHTVAGKEPNAWGVYDMHGNAWEWCWDWMEDYGNAAAVDPTGPSTGEARVVRGGGFYFGAAYCRSAARGLALPESKTIHVGFRPVATMRP